MATSSEPKAAPWVWVAAGLGAVAALGNGGAVPDAIVGALLLGLPSLLIDRVVQQRQSPQVDEAPDPLLPKTARGNEEPETKAVAPKAADPSWDEAGRNAGAGERIETMVDGVDDSPEVERLQEKLKAVEREVEQRLDERRQAAEAELLEAEKARRIEELTQRLEQAEKTLSQIKDPGWSPSVVMPSSGPQKLVRLTCRCGSAAVMPCDDCPSCNADLSAQAHASKSYICGECQRVLAGVSVEQCPKCSAVFEE